MPRQLHSSSMETEYLQKLQIQNILSTNPNMINNPFNPEYVNYNMFNEMTLARLIAAHPYISSLFMGGLTNGTNSNNTDAAVASASASAQPQLPSPSSSSVGSSTIFNRRNVNVSIDDYHEIDVEGQKLPAIIVGGEPRVPLAFLISCILSGVSTDQLKDVMAEHCIRPVECTDLELALFRARVRMLVNIQKCQVLTRTAAEFLARTLLHEKGKSIARTEVVEVRPGVRVKGRVFGKQRGFFRSDLYVAPDAQCIECDSCGTFFAPEKFVGHTHQPEMRHLVHWGYKPSEWRRYLFFFRDKKNRDITCDDERRQRHLFSDLVNRFGPSPSKAVVPPKRKMILNSGAGSTTTSAASSNLINNASNSSAVKINDPLRKRPHVKVEADVDSPPLKRPGAREVQPEAVKTAPGQQQRQQDSMFAPNINVGSIANPPKSAFTPIDRREIKTSFADFLLKETSMVDRLKKQYQVIKQTLETLDISNALKQSLLVEWANLNQGYSSLYGTMKGRLESQRQFDEQAQEKLNITTGENIHLRTEIKELQLQLSARNDEVVELKKKSYPQREPLPVRDRILYQNAKEDLEKSRIQLDAVQQANKSLTDENAVLRLQLQSLLKSDSSPLPGVSKEERGEQEDSLMKEEEEERDEEKEEVDSAATESAPGSSQPQSPDSPASPFIHVDSTIYRPLVKREASSVHTGHPEEDEYGPPTLTRELD